MAFNKQKALDKAEKYAAKGQHDRAAREYQGVVDNDPKDIRAWLMLADCLVRSGEREKAIDRYVRVAQSYAAQKQPQKAVAVYRQILNLDGARLDVQMRVAELDHALGHLPDAIAGYEVVAQAHMQAGRTPDALAAYRLAADADATSISKRLRLAELYSRENMMEEAAASFGMAADALLANGRKGDYVRVAERLIYHKKDDLGTLRQLALVYLELGESRRALMKLNALLHVESNDPEGLELLAHTFVALEKPDKAVSVAVELARALAAEGEDRRDDLRRVLGKGLEWDPQHSELIRMLRDVEVEEGELEVEEEIEELDIDDSGIVELDDGDVLIEELEDEDDFEELDVLDEAPTAEQPLTQSVLDEVTGPEGLALDAEDLGDTDKVVYEARVYLKYKLFDHALEHVHAVLEEDPEHAGALGLRARTLRELGRNGEAADAYCEIARAVWGTDMKLAGENIRAALECAPEHEDAVQLLAALDGEPGEPVEAPAVGSADIGIEDDISIENEVEAGIDIEDDLDLSDIDAIEVEDEVPAQRAGGAMFEAGEEEAFEELEAEFIEDDGLIEVGDEEQTHVVAVPEDNSEFAIELQVGEPEQEPPRAPVAVENRFGLSEARPLPEDERAVTRAPEPELDAEPDAEPAAWPDISDEIAEIRFFADQGLDDDVEFALGDLERRHSGHPELIALKAGMGAAGAPPEDEEAAKPLVNFDDGEDEDEDAFLEAMLSGEQEPKEKKGSQVGARADMDDADARARFDLGTAYREMGLVDDAIAQFEAASGDPKWRAKALIMLGTLRVHRGETDRAIADLKDALEAGQTADETSEAGYELGLVYAKAGQTAAAIAQLEEVDEGFRDREERLAELRAGGS